MKTLICDICKNHITDSANNFYRRSGWFQSSKDFDLCKDCAGKVLYFIESLKHKN